VVRRDERGQNLVELALVLPLLLLLLGGIVDIGRAFYSYIEITNAAREGARAAARLPCYPADSAQRAVYQATIEQIVRTEVSGSMVLTGSLGIAISPDPTTACALGGGEVRVTVTVPHSMMLAGITGIGDFTMTSSTAMSRAGK
jgi:Flp pilus assembly protein TadG